MEGTSEGLLVQCITWSGKKETLCGGEDKSTSTLPNPKTLLGMLLSDVFQLEGGETLIWVG